MPFLGQDWRSPGEQWVKTAEGWEKLKCWRMKLLCNLSENVCSRELNKDLNSNEDPSSVHENAIWDGENAQVEEEVQEALMMEEAQIEEAHEQEAPVVEEAPVQESQLEKTQVQEASVVGEVHIQVLEEAQGEDWIPVQEADCSGEYMEDHEALKDSEKNRGDDSDINEVQAEEEEEQLLRLAHRGQVEQRQEDTKITQPPVPSQPHLLINKSSTRELKSQVSLADVFTKLDMTGAVRDLRRFNYVCKMIDLLICYKLSQVSGTGQKYMFLILQEILTQVTKTNTNLHIMQKLLNHLKVALLENHYSHVGSFKLWEKHREVVEQMQNQLSSLQLKQREDDGGLKLSDLPDDCVREILQRLSDAGDIVNTGMTESRNLSLSQEQNLWKAMCLFHFNNIQIRTMMPVDGVSTDSINWQRLYRKLYKRYGKKECYAEMLNLCNNCHTVFWEHHGHPCLNQEVPERASPLSPAKFIQMFT